MRHPSRAAVRAVVVLLCAVAFLWSHSVGADDAGGVEVQVLAKTSSSWNGAALPDYPRDPPEITILRIVIPPGATLPVHAHPVINAGVLVSGRLTVMTEDKRTLHLGAGDAIVEVVNTWHRGTNEGDTPAEIVVFYAGSVGALITITDTDPGDH